MFHLNNILPPLLLLLATGSINTASVAGITPFNKDINLEFGPEIEWVSNETGVMKSGMARQRSDLHHYHLSINTQQLRLQLTTNDAGTEANNARELDSLDILDILINGQRLPLFQWCLDNRLNATSYKVLSKDSRVKNNVCAVDIVRGEISITLDNESKNLLTQAKNLSINIRPGKHIIHLTYNMKGFSQKLNALNLNTGKPRAPKTLPIKAPPVIVEDTKISLCYVRPPAAFSKKIKPASYPCKNNPLRDQAQKSINKKISRQKKLAAQKSEQRRLKQQEELRIAKIKGRQLQKTNQKNELETTLRELTWRKKDTSLWVGRCMKHWNNGKSPCYCQPYLEHAPANTKDTCEKQDYNQLTQD